VWLVVGAVVLLLQRAKARGATWAAVGDSLDEESLKKATQPVATKRTILQVDGIAFLVFLFILAA